MIYSPRAYLLSVSIDGGAWDTSQHGCMGECRLVDHPQNSQPDRGNESEPEPEEQRDDKARDPREEVLLCDPPQLDGVAEIQEAQRSC